MPKNLLPNASFELDFGEGLCTNWGDLQNELTLPLSLTGQQERTPPYIEARDDAVDGEYAARSGSRSSGGWRRCWPPHLASRSGQAGTGLYPVGVRPQRRTVSPARTRVCGRGLLTSANSRVGSANPGNCPRTGPSINSP